MTFFDHVHAIGPALVCYAGAGAILSADLFHGRRAAIWGIAMLAAVGALGWTLAQAILGAEAGALSGAIRVDAFSIYLAFLIGVVLLAVVLAAREWAATIEQAAEFYALLLVSAGSMILLAQANDLITIFVALETTSISQFILAGVTRNDRSSEAGLKYLLTGAVAAAILLYGFAFLFGMAGTTSLDGIAAWVATGPEAQRLPLMLAFVLVAVGLGFKMAMAPSHAWAPDVYEGAPTLVATFLSVASKAAGFAVALRLFYTGLGGGDTIISQDWGMMFGALAAISMIVGNTGALVQTNAKRLLGYSSIAQAGNIAVGLAAVAVGSTNGPSGVLFFLGTYAATNIGAFVVVNMVTERLGSEQIEDFAGLIKRSPVAAVVLSLCLVSLTGIPPTAGFIAKVYIFNSAVQAGERWLVALVALAVLNTAISAYYYLRWVRTMLLDEPKDTTPIRATGATQFVLAAATVGVLFFGLDPSPLLHAAQDAAAALL
ncbi:MAG: NADH-quinone oxidoreductase subunit N [Chloroflexi bacterium]|nr:MAG: NADH-quinone oxidoreductase subunit N [Chloroflexota bacterium]